MAGITRYIITNNFNGSGAWRFKRARKLWPAAMELYRAIFDYWRSPLQPGYEEIEISRDDFMAGYDRFLGIDLILKFDNGMESTLQEKFLFTTFDTVTVEYMDDWENEVEGDWFRLKAQYYFVGYQREVALEFDRWVLLNWAHTQLASNRRDFEWHEQYNQHDGARASFQWAVRGEIPNYCKLMDSERWLSVRAQVPKQKRAP